MGSGRLLGGQYRYRTTGCTLSGRTGFVIVLVVDQIEGDHAEITRQGFSDTAETVTPIKTSSNGDGLGSLVLFDIDSFQKIEFNSIHESRPFQNSLQKKALNGAKNGQKRPKKTHFPD